MTHLKGKSHRGMLTKHLLLAAPLVLGAIIALHWSSLIKEIGTVAGASVAVAIALHLGVVGLVLAAVRSHRHRNDGDQTGATLHSARFYDWFAAAYCLGREGRMRERTLDVAAVAAGERVLDVCCGTGTLALAAQRRVGEGGSVHGIDASPEMIARARTKAARRKLPVRFDIAAAQSLPFPDAAFDVAICSLALHHLPEDARGRALEQMRRVVKPGGRVLIVEFAKGRGAWALLHPIALLHHRRAKILEEAVTLMKDGAFEHVTTGPLGFAGLAYALGHRISQPSAL